MRVAKTLASVVDSKRAREDRAREDPFRGAGFSLVSLSASHLVGQSASQLAGQLVS